TAERGCERRTRALPGVSGGGDAMTGSVSQSGKGRRATDREGGCPAGRWRNGRAPLLPEHEMAQDALDDILFVDERNDAHFREHFGAPQRVGLPHLLDQLAPLLARDAAPIPAWSPGAQEWPTKRQNQNSKPAAPPNAPLFVRPPT